MLVCLWSQRASSPGDLRRHGSVTSKCPANRRHPHWPCTLPRGHCASLWAPHTCMRSNRRQCCHQQAVPGVGAPQACAAAAVAAAKMHRLLGAAPSMSNCWQNGRTSSGDHHPDDRAAAVADHGEHHGRGGCLPSQQKKAATRLSKIGTCRGRGVAAGHYIVWNHLATVPVEQCCTCRYSNHTAIRKYQIPSTALPCPAEAGAGRPASRSRRACIFAAPCK